MPGIVECINGVLIPIPSPGGKMQSCIVAVRFFSVLIVMAV